MFWHIAILVILIGMIAVSWVAPRSFGLLGLLCGHYVCAMFGCPFLGAIAVRAGLLMEFDAVLAIQSMAAGILFNIVMLPAGLIALRRWNQLSPLSRQDAQRQSRTSS